MQTRNMSYSLSNKYKLRDYNKAFSFCDLKIRKICIFENMLYEN
jgi:hypothetical protein